MREFFPTPPGVCKLMVDLAVAAFTPNSGRRPRVLEPSAGEGALVAEIQNQTDWEITAVEPDAEQKVTCKSWLKCKFEELDDNDPFDVVIMNPPFTLAQEHIKKALDHLRPGGTLVCLVRLSFIGSQKRQRFYRRNPPSEVVVISPRPSFTSDGKTDSSEYAIVIWRKGHNAKTILSWSKWFAPTIAQNDAD